MHDDPIRILERRLERERKARKAAEQRLEEYSSQLFNLNDKLVSLTTQLEHKVKLRTAELMEARDKAVEASRAKSEFLAVMSHEIRTPMNGVLGMLKLLHRSNLGPHQKRYTEVALASGESLLSIISDILDYSKLDAGKMLLEQVPFELQTFMEDTAALYCASAQKKGIELVLSLEPPLPSLVVGDPTRLKQVLSNLLNNAIKFTEKGHVALHVTCVGENLIHFSVVDSGIGMTVEQQQAIFEPFTQADSSHTRKYGGTGLGLSICRKLVEAMGGQLSVMSAPSIGSEFSFELMLAEAGDNALANGAGTVAFASKRVLIVDHYWASRVALRNMLKKNHIMDVTTSSSGAAALDELQRAESAGCAYEVVLVDIQLPDMSGNTLVSQIRHHSALCKTVTVLLLNMGEGEIASEADFTFSKPVREIDLNTCLSRVVDTNPVAGQINSVVVSGNDQPAQNPSGCILLVDDNDINLLVARELLADLSVPLESVTSGLDAIEAVRKKRYSIILMDIQMPGIDGLETTRRIRLLEGDVANVPIIAMTAHAAAEFNDVCLAAGMNGCLSKPIDPDVVIPLVKQYLNVSGLPKDAAVNSEPSGDKRSAEPPASLPGIDMPRALARVRGNWQILRKVLLSFYTHQKSVQAAFETALQTEDMKSLHMLAHTLKGSSATVGADALSLLAATIDKSSREADVEAIRRDLPALYDEAKKVLDGLSSLAVADTVMNR